MTALTDYPAREEEFGTRAQVLPLFKCTSALGTQIAAALRLRFRLQKSVRRAQVSTIKVCVKPSPNKCTTVQTRLHKLFANAQKYASCVDNEDGRGYNTLNVHKRGVIC